MNKSLNLEEGGNFESLSKKELGGTLQSKITLRDFEKRDSN